MFPVAVAILGAVLAGICARRYQRYRRQLELNGWRERLAHHLMRLGSKLRSGTSLELSMREFSVSTDRAGWSGAASLGFRWSQLCKQDAQPELQTLGQLISVYEQRGGDLALWVDQLAQRCQQRSRAEAMARVSIAPVLSQARLIAVVMPIVILLVGVFEPEATLDLFRTQVGLFSWVFSFKPSHVVVFSAFSEAMRVTWMIILIWVCLPWGALISAAVASTVIMDPAIGLCLGLLVWCAHRQLRIYQQSKTAAALDRYGVFWVEQLHLQLATGESLSRSLQWAKNTWTDRFPSLAQMIPDSGLDIRDQCVQLQSAPNALFVSIGQGLWNLSEQGAQLTPWLAALIDQHYQKQDELQQSAAAALGSQLLLPLVLGAAAAFLIIGFVSVRSGGE